MCALDSQWDALARTRSWGLAADGNSLLLTFSLTLSVIRFQNLILYCLCLLLWSLKNLKRSNSHIGRKIDPKMN